MGLTNNLGKLSNMITSTGSAVGIGTSSLNWNYGLLTPLQIRNSSLYAYSDYELGMQTNSYYDGSWKYQGTNSNNLFQITLGTGNAIKFNYAAYGTAGNAFTWTEAMRVTPTGAVGIGTSAPASILEVSSAQTTTTLTSTTTTNFVELQFGNTTNYLQVGVEGATPSRMHGTIAYNGYLGTYNNYGMTFHTNNENRMTITSAGNVGIGTITPQVTGTNRTTLDISGTNTSILVLSTGTTWKSYFYNDGTNLGIANNGGFINFNNGNAEFMRITSAGQLCIGTSSASSNVRLNIARVSGAASIKSASDAGGNLVLESYDSSGQVYIQNYTAGDTYIGLGGGQVGIGTTTGTSLNASLAIARDQTYPGDVNPATLILCGKTDTAKRMSMGYDTTSNYAWIVAGQYGVQWTSLYFQKSGGAVYAGSARIDNNSDERVKDNIQPLTGALDKVLAMNGKKFHMLDEPEDKIRLGFIAQELEGVVDELVIHSDRTQTLPNGEFVENILGLETLGSSWAALLVEAIKELEARLKTLENK